MGLVSSVDFGREKNRAAQHVLLQDNEHTSKKQRKQERTPY